MTKLLYLIICLFLSTFVIAQDKSKANPELIGEWRLYQNNGYYNILLFDSTHNVLTIKTTQDSTFDFTYTYSINILKLTDGLKEYQNKVLHLTSEGHLIFANFLNKEGNQYYHKVERKQVTYH